jgi:hypothetical protein
MTTLAPPTTMKDFAGIECRSITGSPGAIILQGCNGDSGGGSRSFNLNGNGPWTITWDSGRTTVIGDGSLRPPPFSQNETTCPSELIAEDEVISGYVNNGPLPGVLHASVCVTNPLTLQPGTLLTVT